MALASCGTRSGSQPGPDVHATRPPPEVCAPVAKEPTLPDSAGLPQAVTPEQKAALGSFLNAIGVHVDWSHALATRAAKTKTWCDAQERPPT